MKIIVAKSAGFCMGVDLALRKLDATLSQHHKRIVTFGPIIHNPEVLKKYATLGVLTINSPDEVQKGDCVIIRAHGIPKLLEQQLKDCGATIIDATCPKVTKAQIIIAKEHAKGKELLLYGEIDHPEVQGLISHAGKHTHVFSSLKELQDDPPASDVHWFLAAQTTQDQTEFQEIANWAQQYVHSPISVLKTLCDATQLRQTEVLTIANEAEAVIIVGGLNSGNTKRLAEISQKTNTPTWHIEKLEDLPLDELKQYTVIGLSAGASTPKDSIEKIYSSLASFL